MKTKSNRIIRKPNNAPIEAAAKHPQQKLNGTLVKADGCESVKNIITKLGKSHYASAEKPAATRRKENPKLILELRRFLSKESFATLVEIKKDFGASIETQLAGALGAWLAFVERQRIERWSYSKEFLGAVVQKFACVLDPDQVDFLVQEGRPKMVSKAAAAFFIRVFEQQMTRPFNEARPTLEGLRDVIEGHPGFEDQEKALTAMLEARIDAVGSAIRERAELAD